MMTMLILNLIGSSLRAVIKFCFWTLSKLFAQPIYL